MRRALALLSPAILIAPGYLAAESQAKPQGGAPKKVNVKHLTDEQVLKIQREHIKKIDEKLGFKSETLETEHFVIHGDIDEKLMKETGAICEALNKEFRRIFKYGEGDKLYKGKFELFLWKNRAEFIKFAAAYDRYDARVAGGYFRSRGPIAHVNMFWHDAERDPLDAKARFFEVTVHELTHAHLRFYRSANRLRPWIHEGLANLMAWYVIRRHGSLELINRVKTKGNFVKILRQRADAGSIRDMKTLMRQPVMPGNDLLGYSTAWIVVANLVSLDNGAKFMAFVRDMKDEPAETAKAKTAEVLEKSYEYQDRRFKERFGVTPQRFETVLKEWLRRNKASFDKAFWFQ